MQKSENFTLGLSTVVIGVLAGISSGLLSWFLDSVERFALNWQESLHNAVANEVMPSRRLLAVTIGAIIVAVFWYFLRRRQPLVGVEGALAGKQMPVSGTIMHVLLQIFFVATGGSVGREVAPREAGALIAQQWQQLTQRVGLAALTQSDRQLLIASAAGAGFAGIYISPMTGTLFAIEVLLKQINLKITMVSLSMASIAAFVGGSMKGFNAYYHVGNTAFHSQFVLIILLVAPLSGLVGAWFKKSSGWATTHQTTGVAILWQLPIMGLITGLITMFGMPQIMGNGRALAQTALDSLSVKVLPFLLLAALLKYIVTILTIRAGAAGGFLTPAIGIGSSLGAMIGILLSVVVPGISIWQSALFGAVTLLAASQQAPLMAMFMLFEITHLNATALLPLTIGVGISTLVSRAVLKQPIVK